MRIRDQKFIDFDDVLLLPQHSEIDSRENVDTSSYLYDNAYITTPLVSANMDTVTGPEMSRAISSLGGIGILHRFVPLATQRTWVKQVAATNFGISIGVNDFQTSLAFIDSLNYRPSLVCIDVAHGDHKKVLEAVKEYKKEKRRPPLLAGNIATRWATYRLIEAGADVLKVGIGGGSHCTTRIETGHGMPQLSAIMEVKEAVTTSRKNVRIMADGGIRSAGDIVKALAAGADTVMIGRLFAGTAEAPGPIYHNNDGKAEKLYRGSASFDAKLESGREVRNVEGVASYVPYQGPLENVFNRLMDGVRSGLSYSGCASIRELQEKAIFVRK